jgi:hypothetical protein
MTYGVWFDYMCWAIEIAGAVCGFSMLSEPAGRKRGLLKLSTCLLLATGFGCASTKGILFNLRAPTLNATGQLFDVFHHNGKNSSTDFRLRVPTGKIDALHLDSDRLRIMNGELARVTYQADSYALLHIEILDGPYAGYTADGSNGLTGAIWGLLASICIAAYGIVNWISDGNATTPDSDTRAMPDGGVDTQSMLNLNSLD